MPIHVIQRGNNRQPCFAKNADLAAYANWLAEYTLKFQIDLHAWVFMTNHVHLLLTPQTDDGVSKLMQSLGRQYVRYFNHTYTRTGTLFEGRYKSNLVQQEHYLLSCQCYIELNPVRAGMVKDPGDYRWSSYRAHAFGVNPKMWSPHPIYENLGTNKSEKQLAYRSLFVQTMDTEVVAKIRHCSNTGLVLGTDSFREKVKQLTG
jgi:putative transposase